MVVEIQTSQDAYFSNRVLLRDICRLAVNNIEQTETVNQYMIAKRDFFEAFLVAFNDGAGVNYARSFWPEENYCDSAEISSEILEECKKNALHSLEEGDPEEINSMLSPGACPFCLAGMDRNCCSRCPYAIAQGRRCSSGCADNYTMLWSVYQNTLYEVFGVEDDSDI
jgi:hypothetical protein